MNQAQIRTNAANTGLRETGREVLSKILNEKDLTFSINFSFVFDS